MAEKDFKVKNGLYVTDSANVNHLRVRSDGIIEGDLTVSGSIIGTTSGFDSAFSAKTTDSLSEGDINLYYTTARADSAFDDKFMTKTTDSLSEGTLNLYYTTARADSAFDVRLALASTDSLSEGDNLYYTTARADSAFDVKFLTKTTDSLAEGDNLYYTTARADSDARSAMVAGTGMTYDSATGTISIPQEIKTTSEVTFKGVTADSATLGPVTMDSAITSGIKFRISSGHLPYQEGLLWYDNMHASLNYYSTDSNVIHELGLEEHQKVYNNSGSTILKGQPLYFSGNYLAGDYDVPTVGKADATDVNKYNAQGIAAADIPNGSYGYCLTAGQLFDVDTSALSAGQNFFVGLTPGAVQNASPVYPNYPMCLGWVVKSDATTGILLVNQQNHSVRSFRVQTSAHVGQDLIIDGDLTVNGTQTIASSASINTGASFLTLLTGDTIGEDNTTFTGSGLDDAFFSGHYEGTISKTFYVRIDATGTPDTFEWSLDNFSTTEATGVAITGAPQALQEGISIDFGATTGHTSGDVWSGTAAPTNVDTGLFSNRNTGATGVGYTNVGMFFDVTDSKWKFVEEYDSTPGGAGIDTSRDDFKLATVVASNFEGLAERATRWDSDRTFTFTGDIISDSATVNGTSDIAISIVLDSGVVTDSNISASAAIVDTKLATISTAGKVLNSATTATDSNSNLTIVSRDSSGNFAANLITADFDRSANTTVTAGVYGSASLVPVLTIDSSGFIDSAGTVSVAGVSSVSFDSASFVYKINTADGDSYPMMLHTRLVQDPGVFGSGSLVPIISVDSYGHVDSIGTASVAGVDSASWDSASSKFTINTADGNSYTTLINSFNKLYVNDQLIDSAWVTARADQDYVRNIVDSNYIYTAVDSAYIKTVEYSNNEQLKFGDSNLVIYSNGTNSFISEVGIGDLVLQGANIRFENGAGEYYIRTYNNGKVALYNDNTVRLETSGTGVTVTGDVVADSGTFTTLARAATVDSGTYGSTSLIPVITVNTSGFIDSIGTVAVAGVSSVSFDSASGVYTINTANGDSYAQPVFSRALTRGSLVAGSGITYDSARGVIDVTSGFIDTVVDSHLGTTTGDGIAYSNGVISIDSSTLYTYFNHDDFAGWDSNKHISHTSVTLTAGVGLAGGGNIAASREFRIDSSEFNTYIAPSIDHNILTNWDSNKHIDHSAITITAGVGLNGGGTINHSRTLNLDSAQLNNYFGGAGRGFDADQLDGQEGSYYRINVYDASGTLLN